MVMSGEQMFITPFGSSAKLAMDGSITLTDKAGSVIKQDGTGNITATPASGKNVFLGGNGTTGTFKAVLCVGNVPSINVMARTA
jgi:hypothetical protein